MYYHYNQLSVEHSIIAEGFVDCIYPTLRNLAM